MRASQSTSVLIVITGFEVIGPELSVGELSQSLREQCAVPDAVVAGVVKLPARSPLISLGHRIAHNPFGPIFLRDITPTAAVEEKKNGNAAVVRAAGAATAAGYQEQWNREKNRDIS